MNPNDCNEVAPHIAAKGRVPSPDEKPHVQIANETLADVSPTGYSPHTPCEDLDREQLESQEPSDTDGYHEAENRVHSEEATEENTHPGVAAE